ncbi:MAG: hypothetical protein Ct9H300mP16_06530 [Pseudomonadota bacterium]|nr:MAG: hypothetical protein Ct9H300mP16_06530 [Pseudomonadota bacterium]
MSPSPIQTRLLKAYRPIDQTLICCHPNRVLSQYRISINKFTLASFNVVFKLFPQ